MLQKYNNNKMNNMNVVEIIARLKFRELTAKEYIF